MLFLRLNSHPTDLLVFLQLRALTIYYPEFDEKSIKFIMRSYLAFMALLTVALAVSPFQIPTMNIQGPGPTGIPGGGTAPANVTISFTLQDPNTGTNTTCGATYLPENYPQTYTLCADPSMAFKFESPYNFSTFTLDVRHTYVSNDLETSTYGGVYIVGNGTPGQPDNYLTCYGGAPFDGIRCHIINPAPISIPITSILSFKAMQLAPISTYSPPLLGNNGLQDNVSISVADPNTVGSASFSADCVLSWSSIASPPGVWEDCSGDGFAVLIPDNTFLDVSNFEVQIRHEYTSAYQ